MWKSIRIFFIAGITTACVFGMSNIFDRARSWHQMDLRFLVLEPLELSKLQADNLIMVDISIDAPLGSTKEHIDSKYVFHQKAGDSIIGQLRILEKILKREVIGLYQIQVTTRNQIILLDASDIETAMPQYTTKAGDVLILRPLQL